jgi:hypothetical protein
MKLGDIVTRTLLGLVLLPVRALVEPRSMAAKPTRNKARGQVPTSIAQRQ